MEVIAKFDRQSLPPLRNRRLRTVSAIPTLLTLGNLLCGFAAVHFCIRAMFDIGANIEPAEVATLKSAVLERLLPSYFSIACFLVFGGIVFDLLDGRVARLTRRTSTFGGQLDSLADIVTFGVAPAILVIAVTTKYLRQEWVVTPLGDDVIGRAVWMTAAVYVCCAALRLARFNVEHAGNQVATTTYQGLPSPGAGALVASLVLLHEWLGPSGGTLIVRVLPWVTLAAGLLMVSRIPYVHVGNAYLKGRRPFWQVVLVLIGFMVFLLHRTATPPILLGAYAASGPLTALVRWIRSARRPAASSAEIHESEGSASTSRRA